MSTYHYLDENNKPCGPVDEAGLREVAEKAKTSGRDIMIAKPGDSQWLPFSKAFAAGAPAPAARPQQLIRSVPVAAAQPAKLAQPQPVKPAAQPAAAPAQEAKVSPAVSPEPTAASQPEESSQPSPVSPAKSGARMPWLAIACYAVAGLFVLMPIIVIAGVAILSLAGSGGDSPGTAAGAVNFLSALMIVPGCLISALFFALAGKSLSLLNEIAYNTRH